MPTEKLLSQSVGLREWEDGGITVFSMNYVTGERTDAVTLTPQERRDLYEYLRGPVHQEDEGVEKEDC